LPEARDSGNSISHRTGPQTAKATEEIACGHTGMQDSVAIIQESALLEVRPRSRNRKILGGGLCGVSAAKGHRRR
jgi:hypothetical protein